MKVLVPLPKINLDPAEAAIPWATLRTGCELVFSTPDGIKANAEKSVLTGAGLGILSPILKLNKEASKTWEELEKSEEFSRPISYEEASKHSYDALLLPGGYGIGIRDHLDSTLLQDICARHWQKDKPIGAIGRGVVLLARASIGGRPLLYGKKATTLPKTAELIIGEATKRNLGDTFRPCPETTAEDEVKAALKENADFVSSPFWPLKDSLSKLWAGFCVCDGNLVTARWAGDAHKFSMKFKELLA